ncbi:unnamed protein product [Vitrella brassicaformis CCMP3155]|uniref:NAD(P)-binding domain-containing protein n=1 Tax=Vitrella brassicaformis (strain CCMP3155) TaxID=1169540 RepID=A0A0G4EAH5_VITBC|nr:unnamed protein product [Vitrella brassicaformis CCMP3155]|eukprot:CEL92961.1 unnamed protein product [Vitrella brassicaformis CCMP3155]
MQFVGSLSACLLSLIVGGCEAFAATQVPVLASPSVTAATPKKKPVCATGRTGKEVVANLIKRYRQDEVTVRVGARDVKKAEQMFSDVSDRVEIVQCDLLNEGSINKATSGVDKVVWAATGFSQQQSLLDRVFSLIRFATSPKTTVEVEGIQKLVQALKQQRDGRKEQDDAALTRPFWDEAEKEKFVEVTDIPIVKLNPFNILGTKLEGENVLRKSGVPYCIVRPCGLNDAHKRGRPVLVQGDVAIGRINRKDAAEVVCSVLECPEATGKTFEVFTIPLYKKSPQTFKKTLEGLKRDSPDWQDDVGSKVVSDELYEFLRQLQPNPQPRNVDQGSLRQSDEEPEEDEGVKADAVQQKERVERQDRIVAAVR